MKEVSIESLIDNVCDKYNLGKAPLAMALGWGEKNIYRYYKGFSPSKKRIELLKSLCEEPLLFMEYLEKNKSSLSPVAYRKSKEAVEKSMKETSSEIKKIDWMLDYFIANNKELSPEGAKVVLFYTYGFIKSLMKKDTIDLDIYISKNEIIYPQLEKNIKDKCSNRYRDLILKEVEFNSKYVDLLEFATMESLNKYLCCYSGSFLKKMFDENKHIKILREELKEEEISLISQDKVKIMFDELVDEYEMYSSEDIVKYIKDFYLKL